MTDWEVQLEERVLEEGWAHRPDQKRGVSTTELPGTARASRPGGAA